MAGFSREPILQSCVVKVQPREVLERLRDHLTESDGVGICMGAWLRGAVKSINAVQAPVAVPFPPNPFS